MNGINFEKYIIDIFSHLLTSSKLQTLCIWYVLKAKEKDEMIPIETFLWQRKLKNQLKFLYFSIVVLIELCLVAFY